MTVLLIGAGLWWALPGRAIEQSEHLVLYSGRNKSLVEPLIELFESDTGIKVKARYGKTAPLALAILQERGESPADVFWAQDAGALGALSKAGLLKHLSSNIGQNVAKPFQSLTPHWVATSGRARVLAYVPARVDAKKLPQSIFDLSKPKWQGRVGWAPTNASFMAFVTAMRSTHGDEKTRQWLTSMKENGAKRYAKNVPIIKALAAGEIDLGLSNHYYLLRFKKADKRFPVEQQFFARGDIGNLLNVSGAGILKSSRRSRAAESFVRFLLSAQAQQYFTSEVFEYPVTDGVIVNPLLVHQRVLAKQVPDVPLNNLSDLEGTRAMLKEVGLI